MHALRRLIAGAVELLLPATCAACGALTDERQPLCAGCAATLEPIRAGCARCGLPLAGTSAVACLGCAAASPSWQVARAPFVYGGELATAIRRFKLGGRPELARSLGLLLAPSVAALPAAVDALVPVPLHRRRLAARQYNQASLLARAARAARHAPVRELLDRVRDTPSQSKLDAAARRANVRGAFAVAPGQSVARLHLVLVDDVMTTGATAAACAGALLDAGAARVDVLTLSRAVV